MVVVRCGAVRCGVVWCGGGAVRYATPASARDANISLFPGHPRDTPGEPSPGHSRGTGVTSGTPEHSVGQSSATQQHDKTTQTTGYVNQQSVYSSINTGPQLGSVARCPSQTVVQVRHCIMFRSVLHKFVRDPLSAS